MNTSSLFRTAAVVLLALIIAYLAYTLYQRSSAEQERLSHDMRQIKTMLTEDNAERP
jgi:hypothetical protein